MSVPNAEPAKHSKLRREAETRIKEGTAPPTIGWTVGVNALSLLHKLASSPDSATDALKLLHELQVHQVELDMQHEQIETTQRVVAEDLARYQGLYEYAPVPYLNLSPHRDILECNKAAAQLFESGQDELRGCEIDGLLAAASRPVLQQLLKRMRSDGTSGSCEVAVKTSHGPTKMRVVASAAPGGRSFLVVLVDLQARG
jgi:PAS domain-containing protein